MPSCAAIGCSNTSKKGAKLGCLPTDPERRAIWIRNAGITDWPPTRFGALCEFHFQADMWEKPRVDGKRKLKPYAVPTIFGDLVFQLDGKRKEGDNVIDIEPVPQIMHVQVDPATKQVHIIKDIESNEPSEPEPLTEFTPDQEQEDYETVSIEYLTTSDIVEPTSNLVFEDKSGDAIEITVEEEPPNENNPEIELQCENNVDQSNTLEAQERDLLNLETEYQAMDPNVSGYIAKIKKLEQLCLKSERLRKIMKKKHAQTNRKNKKIISNLQRIVSELQKRQCPT